MDKRLWDVTALGELLVDFTQVGVSERGNPIYEANPGGAPCNVLSMLASLGHRVAFIGKVGDDIHGTDLISAAASVGIDTHGIVKDPHVPTTLAFVSNGQDGEREFSFVRSPGADMMLSREDVDPDIIRHSRIFHYGTLSSTHDNCREATRYSVELAQACGAVISFDPNLRLMLWEDPDDAREQMLWGLDHCHICKLADNELEFLYGEGDIGENARKLLAEHNGIKVLFVTCGSRGSKAFTHDIEASYPGYQVESVDTTGAGDCFLGCALSRMLQSENGIDDLTVDNLTEILSFANAGAALVTTRKGALKSMPSYASIRNLISQRT